jgi:acetyl esterase/lipase
MSYRSVLSWFLTLLLLVACGGLVEQLEAQQKPERPMVLLWPEGAPGAVGTEDRDKPNLTIYLPSPARAVGTGVVVCPGGGYQNLAVDHEGQQIAEWLNSMGVAAFVLRYRLAPRYRHPAPMLDVQRAIRLVRTRAAEFGIAPDRIGVWGFSAGGHLASTAATHFDAGEASAADPINRAGSRPDFAILCYPVITFANEYQHGGSRRNLIGENPDPKLVELLSNEKQVTPQTPPTFLFHTTEDKAVPPENSVFFYLALRKAGVPAEMHIYEQGRHGVGLGHTDVALASWSERLAQWMMIRGLLRR